MQDLTKRRGLAERIRLLIDGQITNDAFDDFLVEEGCLGSPDRTIDEIAWWAWTLYSDTRTYRLRGQAAVDRDTHAAAARAILLLRSGTDYEWPSLQEPFWAFLLRWAAASWWLPTAAWTLFALYNYGVRVRSVPIGPFLLLGSAFVALGCRAAGEVAKKKMQPLRESFAAAGDEAAWPFLSRAQLEEAANSGHLLNAGPGSQTSPHAPG